MAAVSLAPRLSSMSSKRIPLANNPNATNSPFRLAPNSKRPRPTINEQRDVENAHSPPKKKQVIEAGNGTRRAQHISFDEREGKVFLGRPENVPPNAFQKRLAAVRDGKQAPPRPVQKAEKSSDHADAEKIKQWRRHYRTAFPTFVFYFDSLPQDVCIRSSRQITSLGAREEKFFSKSVTHIVTSRPIPPSPSDTETSGIPTSSSRASASQAHPGQRTINPSLLDKSVELQSITSQRGARQASEAASQRRAQTLWQDNDTRRHQASNADVLHKGREMGMKIWALEKFERMMHTMFDVDATEAKESQLTRKAANVPVALTKPEPDLSQLLRNEKNMPTERLPWSDIIPFRGLYIYIHDVNEKNKPVMVREYPKVAQKEDGDWPQFRSVPLPRCPFVEDLTYLKREEKDKERVRERNGDADARKVEQQQPRTRAASAAIEAAKAKTTTDRPQRPVLRDSESDANRMPKPPPVPTSKTFEPPTMKPSTSNNIDSMPPQLGSARFKFPGLTRPGKEPMASGLQQSSVTSAIRSQMLSSTAAGPAGRAGTSKELHQLQRRAVERRSGLSTTAMPSSYVNDVRAAINDEHVPVSRRVTRQKPATTLTRIHEDTTISDDEGEQNARANPAKISKSKEDLKQAVKRESKPGYCENCKDKYEDFNEHVESRKHKKFALTPENWTELDSLLRKLVRR